MSSTDDGLKSSQSLPELAVYAPKTPDDRWMGWKPACVMISRSQSLHEFLWPLLAVELGLILAVGCDASLG